MEVSTRVLGPSEVRWEGIIERLAQEDPRIAEPARERRQRGRQVGFGKVLHCAALDDDVERTGTHRAVV